MIKGINLLAIRNLSEKESNNFNTIQFQILRALGVIAPEKTRVFVGSSTGCLFVQRCMSSPVLCTLN